MELIVSAIVADLAARSISFLVDRYLNRTAPAAEDEERLMHSLQRQLLRVHVVVEEAEQRRITNHAMLWRLHTMREDMYRGYYALDISRCQAHNKDGELSHSFAVSQFSHAKRVRLIRSNSGGQRAKASLQQVLGSLETTIADVTELVTFLARCPPRLGRQPYNMYMFMDKCMFGRQMEMERVIAFLLQEEGHGTRKPGVLTILGPKRAGKSTLVEHACNDETVRNHFSQLVSFTLGDLKDEDTVSLRSRHRSIDGKRVLVIVELNGERNSKGLDGTIIEGLLGRFYSVCKSYVSCVSKIIVTSRTDNIASFATTETLRLHPLTQEAYWYFFKVRAFGSTDAMEHPKLVSIAMDMAVEMDGSFAFANIFSELLRSNFNARFWSLALAVLREFKKRNLFMPGAHQTESDPWEMTKPAYNSKAPEQFVCHDDYQINSSTRGEVPKITLQDVLFGGVRPRGKFDALGWKSPIPPHYSYAYSCEIQRPQRMVVRKKRSMQKIGS